VVVLAQEEARALWHNYIGTEHLLLGLLREHGGVAARVLDSLDINVEPVRASVVRLVGSGEEITEGRAPFTPRAKKMLELALRESLTLGHTYIGTEHLLLGLVRENEGVAARILLDFDADAQKIRNAVIRALSDPEARLSSVSGRVTRRPVDVAWLDGLGAALDRLAVEIRCQLDREPDAGDLLLAVACAPDTLPARTLEELGVDLDALGATIDRLRQHEAGARDQEREPTEAAQALVPPGVLQEIRRRLGLPSAEAPGQQSESG
jgi:ATP-dependent Clp protease ATP-binding subunit ClpA